MRAFIAVISLTALQAAASFSRLGDDFHHDIDDTVVSAGEAHTCVIQQSDSEYGGPIVCFGANDFGQASPPSGTFIQVSAGKQSTCAVKEDQEVACWGAYKVVPRGTFMQVSTGGMFSCGITTESTIECWGRMDAGEGHTSWPRDGKFVQVSAGYNFACAIRDDGAVLCWGTNNSGQCNAPSDKQFVQISSSLTRHTCGITIDKSVVCWGAKTPAVTAAPPAITFRTVSTGHDYSLGVTSDGLYKCWGNCGEIVLKIPKGVVKVSSSIDHTCGVTEDSQVKCWMRYEFDNQSYASVPPNLYSS